MANRFWVGGSGTWDNSTTTHWSASTGGAGGAAVPGSADTAIFDASSGGGTVTVDSTINGLTFSQITVGAFTGTLDFSVNNPSITLTTFSVTGTGTRTLKLGSGTFTLTGTSSNVWDAGTVTNLTFNAGTSTIVSSVTPLNSRALALGGLSYNIISLANSGISSGNLQCALTGSGSTIATLNLTAPIQISFNSSMTITNAFNPVGTAFNNIITMVTTATKPTVTLSAGGTMQWVAVGNATFTGSPTATNSFDLGANSGITITGPSGSGSHMIGG